MLRLKSIKREGDGWTSSIVDDEKNTIKNFSAPTLTSLLFRMKQHSDGKRGMFALKAIK